TPRIGARRLAAVRPRRAPGRAGRGLSAAGARRRAAEALPAAPAEVGHAHGVRSPGLDPHGVGLPVGGAASRAALRDAAAQAAELRAGRTAQAPEFCEGLVMQML